MAGMKESLRSSKKLELRAYALVSPPHTHQFHHYLPRATGLNLITLCERQLLVHPHPDLHVSSFPSLFLSFCWWTFCFQCHLLKGKSPWTVQLHVLHSTPNPWHADLGLNIITAKVPVWAQMTHEKQIEHFLTHLSVSPPKLGLQVTFFCFR